MKKVLPVIILAVAVLGCDISKYLNSGKTDNSNTARPSPTADSKPSPASSPKAETTPAKPGFIDTLKKAKGKYPRDIKLLDISDLNARLKSLLGKDFSAMKSDWNVESPMEIEGDILMASGCEAHNCGDNRYLMFVDLKNDNINVFHLQGDSPKHYFERGEIKLPAKFANELVTDQ